MLKDFNVVFTQSGHIPFYLIILILLLYFTKFSYKNINSLSSKLKKILIYSRITVWIILILSLINPVFKYF